MDARVDPGNVMRSAGLDQHSLAQITQLFHQRQDVLLEQRFTPGYFHQRTIKGQNSLDDLRRCHLFTSVKRVRGITIAAPKIAKGQTDKNARHPRPGALSLDRAIDLINRERRRLALHRKRSSRREGSQEAASFESCVLSFGF